MMADAAARSSYDVVHRLDRRVPEALARRLEHGPVAEPVAPRPAASVVLVRDNPDGYLQVYLLHRHRRMPFAAGMVVFPGGRLDDADCGTERVDEGGVRTDPGVLSPALLRCGIRETVEETGVQLGTEQLYPWAHWITPECEPLRYDTYFYLAVLPAGQHAADISGETRYAEWRSPGSALSAADRCVLALMPPTRATLLELAEFGSSDEARASCSGRRVETVLPRPVREKHGWMFDYGVGNAGEHR